MEKKKELGLYIHIPFCERKCYYCDFLSAAADRGTKAAYVDALIKEINSYRYLKEDYRISTIFIGGGTPSTLMDGELVRIMEAVKDVFQIEDRFLSDEKTVNGLPKEDFIEATIEVNPGTVSREKLLRLKAAGLNRISMGLQSADNKDLKLLGRIHTYETFLDTYKAAREAGFQNINIDLMSALPWQSLQDWMEVLEKVISLRPEHISAYSLIIEEGTPFYEKYSEVSFDDELDRAMYWSTAERLKAAGYGHYEISNYAFENRECRHNIAYWIRKNYLGVGLGAASLIENKRFHKEEDLKKYLQQAGSTDSLSIDTELLDRKQQMEEFMFLGLRLMRGISTKEFQELFGSNIESVYRIPIEQSVREGLLSEENGQLFLTAKGIDLSNTVMARFLL
ncbi:radical SAM family heme chaperone HemW [Anaerocolumna sp. AGMB13020]|uniref:radical SAM family heme chaperone HemW n=1 Tax=Anaerocolumna sp. AGMB13020 TaxID=3081750 RepID=UPI0029546BFC|nr:radical SAM family heme chaperone HemW [Anaerocolumna sp. AGMB13020]WOO36655.1 radical SAM family heme chaperone HemW [Anaerocolumna sp. AGMB13020]